MTPDNDAPLSPFAFGPETHSAPPVAPNAVLSTADARRIFPNDQPDPTIGDKEPTYPVERTLGVIGHLSKTTKARRQGWMYMRLVEAGPLGPDTSPISRVRKFFAEELKDRGLDANTASVVRSPELSLPDHENKITREWAIWGGTGEPDREAFEKVTLGNNDSPPIKPALGNNGSIAEVTNLIEKRLTDSKPAATPRWAYTSKRPLDAESVRARFNRPNARVVWDPSPEATSAVAAIWLGEGEPTSPAFPYTSSGRSKPPFSATNEGEGPLPSAEPTEARPTEPEFRHSLEIKLGKNRLEVFGSREFVERALDLFLAANTGTRA